MTATALTPASDPLKERCPPACPDHGRTPRAGCGPCQPYNRWRQRVRRALQRAGIESSMVPGSELVPHLEKLQKFMTVPVIAERAGVSSQVIYDLLSGKRQNSHRHVGEALLGMPVPTRAVGLATVPAFATHRIIRAAACANYSRAALAPMLGWEKTALTYWMTVDRVTGDVDACVRRLPAKLAGTEGPDRQTRTRAVNNGWLPFEAWPGDTIFDPDYDPRSADPEPFHARRRLRALAYSGHGADWVVEQLATKIRVTERDVRNWTRREDPIPRFVWPLVDPLYQQYARYIGPDQATADHARVHDYASVVDWSEANIDHPTRSGFRPAPRDPAGADPIIMHAAFAGALIAIQLTAPERSAVVHYLARQGRTPAVIGERLKWAPTRAASARAVAAVLAGPRNEHHIGQIRRLAVELAAQQREVRGTPASVAA